MKKIFTFLLAAVCAAGAAHGQEGQKVAVVPTEGASVSMDIRIGITNGLQEGIHNSGKYRQVARGKAFEKALSEMKFQQSGAVSDEQLTTFGHALKADFVCYATVSKYSDQSYRISYKMIDVASGEIVEMGSETVRNGASGLLTATDNIAQKLFGSGTASTNSTSSYTASRPAARHAAEPEMVYVAGGTFTMGCTSEQGGDCESDEKPVHSVTLSSFSIGKYEVTQGQWKAIMGSNPSRFTNGDNYPVERVSWTEVQEFIARLNEATGKRYRLPTEAEWEFAARGGNKSQGYKYSGSHSINNVAWYWDNIPTQNSSASGYGTQPVGTKLPNELGIYDMTGNVWEWCSDWYDSYSSSAQTNPTGASSGSTRVNRGGSWFITAQGCRVAYRSNNTPGASFNNLGFRLLLP